MNAINSLRDHSHVAPRLLLQTWLTKTDESQVSVASAAGAVAESRQRHALIREIADLTTGKARPGDNLAKQRRIVCDRGQYCKALGFPLEAESIDKLHSPCPYNDWTPAKQIKIGKQ